MDSRIIKVASINTKTLLGIAALIVYVLAATVTVRLFGDDAVYILLALPVIPILVYLFFGDSTHLVLAYIAVLPLVQHLNVHGISIGDFCVTPHMVFQLFVLIAIINSFLSTYDRNVRRNLSTMDKTLLLFGLFTLFSLIFAYSLPVNHTKRWLLFYTGVFETVSFYFMIVFVLSRKEDMVEKILIAFLLTSFSSAAIAVQEINYAGHELIKIFLARMRIGFGYHNTNLYGIHSAILFPIFFYILVDQKFRAYRLLTWISFIILMSLSVLCFNRGTFLVIGLEMVLLYLIPENRKTLRWIFAAMIGTAAAFSKLLFFYIFRFVGSGSTAATPYLDPSAMYRFEAWKVGLKLLYLYPLGLGGGGFQYGWELYGTNPNFYLGTPHQLFLSIGVDYGVISMLLFFALLVIGYTRASKLSRLSANNPYAGLFNYLKVSIIGFVVYGLLTDGELSHLSGFIFPNNGYTLLLFTLFAIVSSHSTKYLTSSGSRGPEV